MQKLTGVVEIDGDSPMVHVIHRDVFRRAFTPDELISYEQLRDDLRRNRGVLTAVLDDCGSPLAAAYGEWDPESRVLLLAYLAVRREQRSGGLGGLLMDEVGGAWQDRYRPVLTLAEVEHPLPHQADPDRGDGLARLRFYHRHGAHALDLPYFQPSLRPGAERVYGMLLVVLPPFPVGRDSTVLEAAPVQAFLAGYFRDCEGSVGTDPASRRLWRAVDDPAGVRLLSLGNPAALPVSRPS
jgi:GNAT superfamily N-acetyltransferase